MEDKSLLSEIWETTCVVARIGLFIIAVICTFLDDYQRATFFLLMFYVAEWKEAQWKRREKESVSENTGESDIA